MASELLSNNNTSSAAKSFYLSMKTCTILIGTFGTVGNAAILAMVVQDKSLRKCRYAFVVALTIIDLILAIISTFLAVLRLAFQQNFHHPALQYILYKDNFLCAFFRLAPFAFLHLSIWTLFCVSLERLIAVRFPFKHVLIFTKRTVICLLLVIYIPSIILTLMSIFPINPGSSIPVDRRPKVFCSGIIAASHKRWIITVMIGLGLPTILVVSTSYWAVLIANNHSRKMEAKRQNLAYIQGKFRSANCGHRERRDMGKKEDNCEGYEKKHCTRIFRSMTFSISMIAIEDATFSLQKQRRSISFESLDTIDKEWSNDILTKLNGMNNAKSEKDTTSTISSRKQSLSLDRCSTSKLPKNSTKNWSPKAIKFLSMVLIFQVILRSPAVVTSGLRMLCVGCNRQNLAIADSFCGPVQLLTIMLNPFVFTLRNRPFRQAANNFFGQCCKR
ncbi:unnamed protein product [Dimorphilus gyrociliatus]|uniref:G-protein coupled receptors family 1 profile domain-containing protein n=1 Tax=Dimorphilus gyrociliatus TaxID=2664684 RepID=A0A7I8VPP2_9ANNE|nr:unnamed protein product [Dimorphilus gyrociliatus]